MKEHLADPDLEKMFDTTLGENESEPPMHDRDEKETGYQTPSTTSAAPEAIQTAADDGL